MSEGTNSTETSESNNAGAEGQKQAESKPYEAPATQADLDRIVESRLARERAKFADYDEVKGKASKYDEAEAANKTELQRAQEAAAAAEKRAADAEGSLLRAKVANRAGKVLPPSLAARLVGANEAELEADADRMLEDLAALGGGQEREKPKAPPAAGGGGGVHNGDMTAKDVVDAATGR